MMYPNINTIHDILKREEENHHLMLRQSLVELLYDFVSNLVNEKCNKFDVNIRGRLVANYLMGMSIMVNENKKKIMTQFFPPK